MRSFNVMLRKHLEIYIIYISLSKETEKSRIFTERFLNPAPYSSQLFTDVCVLNVRYQVGAGITLGTAMWPWFRKLNY